MVFDLNFEGEEDYTSQQIKIIAGYEGEAACTSFKLSYVSMKYSDVWKNSVIVSYPIRIKKEWRNFSDDNTEWHLKTMFQSTHPEMP